MGKQADLKRAQTGLESRISWFVLVLLTIQPLLDVMSYFLNLQGKTAISTLLRACWQWWLWSGFCSQRRKRCTWSSLGWWPCSGLPMC